MYCQYDFMLVTVSDIKIKILSAGFMNSEAQDMYVVLVLINSHIMYLGIGKINGQVLLITATNILPWW